MAASEFSLPESSWSEQKKMIEAYFLTDQRSGGEAVRVPEVAQRAAMDASWLSRNNKFFASLGLIEGGQKKRVTDDGKALGLAISHADEGEIRRILARLVSESDFLSRIVSAVKVRSGMDAESLERHIAITAGAAKSARTTTGARSIIDLLKEAGVLTADDAGTLRLSTKREVEAPPDPSVVEPSAPREVPLASRVKMTEPEPGAPTSPEVRSVTVNLTLNVTGDDFERLEGFLRDLTGLRRPDLDSDATTE